MSASANSHLHSSARLSEIEDLLRFLDQIAPVPETAATAEELGELEQQLRRVTERVAGLIVGEVVQASLQSEALDKQVDRLVAESKKPLKKDGAQAVSIQTSTGVVVTVITAYYRRKGQRGTKRRLPGLYPGLVLLGLFEHCTPALSAYASLLAAALSSFEEAHKLLLEQGVELNVKRIRAIAYAFACRARSVQLGSATFALGDVGARQVVVSCDGGRLRIRTNKRGPRTKKGRCRYHGVWREPKLFVVTVIGPDGHQDHSFTPLIDATLCGPDALFSLLEITLKRLHIQEAARVLFVADGARWIWTRIRQLRARLGLSRVFELVDFFHVVEHLGAVAALHKSWSPAQRRRWVKQQRRRLLAGEPTAVIRAIDKLCHGCRSTAIRTERDYVIRNAKRLDYAGAKAAALPIGSGAVESAIRRVINLRLEGASIYWLKQNAEAMLMLRSYFKAGRCNLLKRMAHPSFMTASI
jgi:hypothetical protein